MPTQREVEAIADILSDEQNKYLTDVEVARLVLAKAESFRRQPWKYVTITQARERAYLLKTRGGEVGRLFTPTWARGPFTSFAQSVPVANADRELGFKVMHAQVFDVDTVVDLTTLEEIIK